MKLLEKLCDEAEFNFKPTADLIEVQQELEEILQKVQDKQLKESIMATCNVYAGTVHDEGVKQGFALAYSLGSEVKCYISKNQKH